MTSWLRNMLPSLALMVNVYVPVRTPVCVVRVRVDVCTLAGVRLTLAGLNVALILFGKVPMLRFTMPAYALTDVKVTV